MHARVTGFDRSPMIAEMFNAGSVTLLRTNDQFTGYAITRPFGLGHVLGPLVARNDGDAEASFSATARPGVLRVDRRVETEILSRFLEARDLPGHKITHSMVLGTAPNSSGKGRIFSMAGHAWG